MTIPSVPFVVGCQRSGTSLLTVLLDRHSDLSMLPETHLLHRSLWDRPGWPTGPTHEHLLVAAWHRAWFRLRDLHFEPRTILERMRRYPCTPEGLLRTLLDLWAAREGKPIAGEKTPQHIEVVDRILAGIPDAKVTIIVRDGRAVVRSRLPGANASVDELVDHWVHCAELADRWLRASPDRVRLIRFEPLAAHPPETLSPLMGWLGLGFQPGQLVPAPSSTFRRWEDHYKRDAEGPIDQTRGEAWRAGEALLTTAQLDRMAPWLERFGYPAPGHQSTVALPVPVAPVPPHPVQRQAPPIPILVIGAQRAGTATVADWLASDPAVAPAPRHPSSPLLTLWPLSRHQYLDLLGEKTSPDRAAARYALDLAPSYLLHPDVARRAWTIVPEARVLLILRDPVARAYSQWLNEWRLGAESLPFAEALAAEEARLGGIEARLADDPTTVSFNYLHHAYAHRSAYHALAARWLAVFPGAQLQVLLLEDLIADPDSAWAQLHAFLQLAPSAAPALPHRNGLRWPLTPGKLLHTPEAEALRLALAADRRRLEHQLARSLPWSNSPSKTPEAGGARLSSP